MCMAIKKLSSALLITLMGTTVSVSALAEDGVIRIGGSTTLLPIVSTAVSNFMSKYKTWNKVSPDLPEKNIVIFVTGGGSSFGVKSVMNSSIDIGMVSRELKEKELQELGNHQNTLVGKDAVAIAASKNNPLMMHKNNLSSAEIAKIFAGEVNNYKKIDSSLPDKEIVLFVRDAGAGSTELLQEEIMKEKQISKNALQLPSQGSLLQKMQGNQYGLGYISSGLIAQSDGNLKAFAIDSVQPSNANVLNAQYKLARPMTLLIKGKPDQYEKALLDYLLGEGQSVVETLGFVPVKN